jgi:hypothetical protein
LAGVIRDPRDRPLFWDAYVRNLFELVSWEATVIIRNMKMQ